MTKNRVSRRIKKNAKKNGWMIVFTKRGDYYLIELAM